MRKFVGQCARSNTNVLPIFRDQYSKKGQFFQVSTPTRWFIVAPPKYIDEIREAPVENLSPRVAANDVSRASFRQGTSESLD